MKPIALIIGVLIVLALFMVPSSWLVMLMLGNFGFGQFGLVDCLPAGAILSLVAGSRSND